MTIQFVFRFFAFPVNVDFSLSKKKIGVQLEESQCWKKSNMNSFPLQNIFYISLGFRTFVCPGSAAQDYHSLCSSMQEVKCVLTFTPDLSILNLELFKSNLITFHL